METLAIKSLTSNVSIEGMEYKGSVSTVANLPTPSQDILGNVYTVVADGHEHVCDGTQWIDLSADLVNKQDKADNDLTTTDKTVVGAINELNEDIVAKEDTDNKVTSVSSLSTDIQYPSAKCVYDEIISKLGYAPSYAATTAEMTDTSKVYVGSNGHLYAYRYESTEVEIPITWKPGYKCSYTIGSVVTFSSSSDYCVSDFIAVEENKQYTLKNLTPITNYSSFRILACDSSGVIKQILEEHSSWTPPTTLQITIPSGCTKIVIRPYDGYGTTRSITLWRGSGGYDWVDTGIAYANYSLTDADKLSIAQKVLDYLDVTSINLDNILTIGSYELDYGDANTSSLGEVNNQ